MFVLSFPQAFMMFCRTLLYLVFVAGWASTFASSAISAEFKYLGQAKNIYTPYGYRPQTHVFSLSGTIQVGDTKKIRAMLPPLLETTTVFCETDKPAVVYLNSTGGSFSEGLKLAGLFRELGIGTIVRTGNRCLSACAVSFLGGTRHLCLDGDTGSYRRLQPGAQLGFHAPRLVVPERSYTKTQIASAYDTAVKQIGQLVDEIKKAGMKASLAVEMLKVGVSDFYYIDTIGKAGRWGFDVAIPKNSKPTPNQLVTACANADAWMNDSFQPTADFENLPSEMTTETLAGLYRQDRLGTMSRAFIQATGMYAKSCMVELGVWPNTGRRRYWVKFFDENIQDVQKMYKGRRLEAGVASLSPIHFYNRNVRLSDLPFGK